MFRLWEKEYKMEKNHHQQGNIDAFGRYEAWKEIRAAIDQIYHLFTFGLFGFFFFVKVEHRKFDLVIELFFVLGFFFLRLSD